jgi:hypothetical protein
MLIRWTSYAIAALALAASAFGQTNENDDTNAATWYRQAIERYNALTQEQREIIGNYDWNQAPSPELRTVLADTNVRAALGAFQRGAAQPTCDFGLDRSQGFFLPLPHLAPMRQIARMARADFNVALADGDSEAITRNLQSLYLSSGQVGQDDILISTLVGTAIFTLTDGMAQSAIDAAALSPEMSDAVVTAMESLNADDPFGYVDSIIGEREMGFAMIEQYRNGESLDHLAAVIGLEGDLAQRFPTDEAGIDQAVEQYDAFMSRTIDIFSMDDPQAALAAMNELDSQVDAGEFGPLMMMAPAMGKALENRHRAEGMLASRVTQLKQIASGEVTPLDLANAAVWYRRAIALIDSLEPSRRAAICACAAAPGAPLEAETIETLVRPPVQRAIEVLEQASAIKRCQFIEANNLGAPCALIPDHMPGMHEAMCLLLADALRLQAEGQAGAAYDRLAVCTRAAGHLAGEPHLTGSLIAHTAMGRVARIAAGVFAAGSIDDDALERIETALQRHDPTDPFAYAAAARAARQSLIARYVGRLDVRDEALRQEREASARRVEQLKSDEVLYLMAAGWEFGRRRAADIEAERAAREQAQAAAATQPAASSQPGQPAAPPPAPLPPPMPMPPDPSICLADVLNTDALAIVRQEAADLAPWPAQPWQVLTRRTQALPLIAGSEGIDGCVLAAQEIRSRLERLFSNVRRQTISD